MKNKLLLGIMLLKASLLISCATDSGQKHKANIPSKISSVIINPTEHKLHVPFSVQTTWEGVRDWRVMDFPVNEDGYIDGKIIFNKGKNNQVPGKVTFAYWDTNKPIMLTCELDTDNVRISNSSVSGAPPVNFTVSVEPPSAPGSPPTPSGPIIISSVEFIGAKNQIDPRYRTVSIGYDMSVETIDEAMEEMWIFRQCRLSK